MTLGEMVDEVMRLWDKSQNPYVDEVLIVAELNRQQDQFVSDCLAEYEKSQRELDDIATIIVSALPLVSTVLAGPPSITLWAKPDNYRRLLKLEATLVDNQCGGVIRTRRAYLDRYNSESEQDPFEKPSGKRPLYRELSRVVGPVNYRGYTVDPGAGNTVSGVSLSYCRIPAIMTWNSTPALRVNCELPSYVHKKLCDLAIFGLSQITHNQENIQSFSSSNQQFT